MTRKALFTYVFLYVKRAFRVFARTLRLDSLQCVSGVICIQIAFDKRPGVFDLFGTQLIFARNRFLCAFHDFFYIDYYNTKRLQRNLGILTPIEKHKQFILAA